MRRNMSQSTSLRLFLALILSIVLTAPAGAISVEHGHDDGSHGSANPAVERPVWLEKLENQLNHEDVMSGLEGSQQKLDNTFMKLMGQLQNKLKEHASPASSGGMFHDSWSAHQLGQSYLLGPTEAAAKVYKGAHCPSNVPTKTYEVSAINVEVMLNQWGDYYPGYMYVLDKELAKSEPRKKPTQKRVRMILNLILEWFLPVCRAMQFNL